MKIAIGSDKSGFNLKEAIKAYLSTTDVEFDDLGTTDPENAMMYYEVASKVAPLVQNKQYDRAILICGTGAGVCVVSNTFEGVHAVACESVYTAQKSRAINDAQILCMGGWVVAPEMGVEMSKAFLETEFLEGLEDWRQVNLRKAQLKVADIEKENFRG